MPCQRVAGGSVVSHDHRVFWVSGNTRHVLPLPPLCRAGPNVEMLGQLWRNEIVAVPTRSHVGRRKVPVPGWADNRFWLPTGFHAAGRGMVPVNRIRSRGGWIFRDCQDVSVHSMHQFCLSAEQS
jgi:hypothetical protein